MNGPILDEEEVRSIKEDLHQTLKEENQSEERKSLMLEERLKNSDEEMYQYLHNLFDTNNFFEDMKLFHEELEKYGYDWKNVITWFTD